MSLPSRERGLKLPLRMFLLPGISSLPSRERGLKSTDSEVAAIMAASLPSRERGLKCPKATKAVKTEKVAPFAGAWIEIRMKRMSVVV